MWQCQTQTLKVRCGTRGIPSLFDSLEVCRTLGCNSLQKKLSLDCSVSCHAQGRQPTLHMGTPRTPPKQTRF